MRKTRFFTLAAIVAGSMIMQSTYAQGLVTSFIAEDQTLHSDSYIDLDGSFGNERYHLPNSTISAELDLNNEDTTVTFKSVEFDIKDTLELSGQFDQGFGESVLIEGSIDFDSIEFLDDRALSLGAGENNVFPINDFFRTYGGDESISVSGNYEFSGPTESVEGTFEVNPFSWQTNSPRIDTTDFPNGVTIAGRPVWQHQPAGNIVTETIDGVAISVGLTRADFDAPDELEFQNVGIIPEPSTYAFVVGGCLIAFIIFRNFRKSKSAC